MKKPPDKYKTIKLQLKSILYQNEDYEDIFNSIQNAVYRTNHITTKSSLLLRLWCLEKYHQNREVPLITEDTIKMCMRSILLPSSGPKPKGNNLKLYNEFKNMHNFKLENGCNLSSILSYYAAEFLSNINTNIKTHFFDYVKRFINSYFKNYYKDQMNDRHFKKQLFKDLKVVKNDILNGTLNSNETYHEWIEEYRYKIVPKEYIKCYYYDIKCNPQKYLSHMIFMNIELEKIDGKMFQFMPLHTSLIPRHVLLDTKAIVELLVRKQKRVYIKNIQLYQEFLWDIFFDIKQKIKNYQFDHSIRTDGFSVSLRFIHQDYIESENQKKENLKNARKASKENKQTENVSINVSLPPDNILDEDQDEFLYIDDIDKEELVGDHIFIDPGKRTLLTMMDDNGNFYSYTNKQRIQDTKRLKYQEKLLLFREFLGISDIETQLSAYNSKSCILDNYKIYMHAKLSANKYLHKLYEDKKFRQYRWYSFINKTRAEDRLLNNIEKAFSPESIIIIGDWCIEKQMKNFISTPNIGLKRKLAQRFKIYNIDEYRTSCLNYKTESKCENLYLPDKTNKMRKMHSILTYKMENNRYGCINRDKNGCKNIQKLFEYYMKYHERPEKYKRGCQKTLQTANSAVKL